MSGPTPEEIFQVEAGDLLEALEQGLLDLSQSLEDRDSLNAVFRAVHTLKGSGAMFGHDRLAAFLHDFETAFDHVRQGEVSPSPRLVMLALEAADLARALVEAGGDPARVLPERDADLLARLQQCLTAPAASPSAAPAEAPVEERGLGWMVAFSLPPQAMAQGTDPVLLLEELRDLGRAEVVADDARVPALEDMDPEVCYLRWKVRLLGDCTREAVEDVFIFLRDEMQLEIVPLDDLCTQGEEVEPSKLTLFQEVEEPEREAARPARQPNSVRVPAERLDELMDRVGELVIAQARLSQIARGAGLLELSAVAEEIDRLTGGLRDSTMSMRLVPFGSLFGRFRRLVHDLSQDLGKEIRLETSGDETELDKTVMDQLAEPLVHLIRNAMDHGMERPEARQAAGKPREGRITLSAWHVAGEVMIRLEDDGAGLNTGRILAKAEAAGLVPPDAGLSDEAIHRLIFEPGFSTAEQVTTLSGRGVGMDVVRRTIEGLRGVIDIDSAPGRGVSITMRLPLTLAIIDGMLVRIGEERYVIPLSAVEECAELPAMEAMRKGRNFLELRGALVPFLRLYETFGLAATTEPHPKVVIVSSGSLRVGLMVDQILGNSQTVIKQLSPLHKRLRTFAGATILGDGAVVLILDVMNLVAFAKEIEGRGRARLLEDAA